MYVCMYVCMSVCLYVCMYVCMYVCICVHTYICISLSLSIYIYIDITLLLCQPLPSIPAAETAKQPLIWYSESSSSHIFFVQRNDFFSQTPV